MCTIHYGNKEVKYPINTIIFSNKLELRYWIINGNYHIALWYNDDCIVEDNDEPISTALRNLVQMTHKASQDSIKDKIRKKYNTYMVSNVFGD